MISGLLLILLSPSIAQSLFLRAHERPLEGVYTVAGYLRLLSVPAFNLTDTQMLTRMLPFVIAGVVCVFCGVYCRQKYLHHYGKHLA